MGYGTARTSLGESKCKYDLQKARRIESATKKVYDGLENKYKEIKAVTEVMKEPLKSVEIGGHTVDIGPEMLKSASGAAAMLIGPITCMLLYEGSTELTFALMEYSLEIGNILGDLRLGRFKRWVGDGWDYTGSLHILNALGMRDSWQMQVMACVLHTCRTWRLGAGFEICMYSMGLENMATAVATLVAAAYGFIDTDTGVFRATQDSHTPQERVDALCNRWVAERGDLRSLIVSINTICDPEAYWRRAQERGLTVVEDNIRVWRQQLPGMLDECKAAMVSTENNFGGMVVPKGTEQYTKYTNPFAKLVYERYKHKWDPYLRMKCDWYFRAGYSGGHWEEGEPYLSDIGVASLCYALRISLPRDLRERLVKTLTARYEHCQELITTYFTETTQQADKKAMDAEAVVQEANRRLEKSKIAKEVLRERLRVAEQTAKEAADRTEHLERKLKTQDRMLREAGLKEATDIAPYQKRIDELEAQLSAANMQIAEQERVIGRKEKEISETYQALVVEKQKLAEAEIALESASKNIHTLRLQKGSANIPVKCYIEAIRHMRLVVAGGVLTHAKLKAWGLDVKTLAKPKSSSTPDVRGSDLVVILTGFIGHSDEAALISQISGTSVPYLRSDAHTAEQVVLDVFAWKFSGGKSNSVFSNREQII